LLNEAQHFLVDSQSGSGSCSGQMLVVSGPLCQLTGILTPEFLGGEFRFHRIRHARSMTHHHKVRFFGEQSALFVLLRSFRCLGSLYGLVCLRELRLQFDCTAALGDSCAALAHAGPPSFSSPASLVRPHSRHEMVDVAGWHRNLVHWTPRMTAYLQSRCH